MLPAHGIITHGIIILHLRQKYAIVTARDKRKPFAGLVELVDTRDLKSLGW